MSFGRGETEDIKPLSMPATVPEVDFRSFKGFYPTVELVR